MATKRPSPQNGLVQHLAPRPVDDRAAETIDVVDATDPIIPLRTRTMREDIADETVAGETEDATLPWEQWEEQHAKKRRTLLVIVAIAMVGIVGIWGVSLTGTIAALRVASSANSENARAGFLERFSAYQRQLDVLNATANATSTTPQRVVPTSTSDVVEFVASLKNRVTEAAAAPTVPAPSTP